MCTAFKYISWQILGNQKKNTYIRTCFGNAVNRHGSKQPLSAKQLIFLALHGLAHWGHTYRKVASSNKSRLEVHAGFFRLLMKGILGL